MDTDTLIDMLAADTAPVGRHVARTRIALGMAAALAIVLVLVAATLGFRPDLDIAMAGNMFWMKLAFSGSLTLVAVSALTVLVRPEARPPRWLWLAVVPVALFGLMAAQEGMTLPAADWRALWLGRSWQKCPWLIVAFALPVGAVLTFIVRRFAPTRLRATGAVIGLAAGASSALLYSLHCPETGATFVVTWYALGIALATALGALLGPRLLRW